MHLAKVKGTREKKLKKGICKRGDGDQHKGSKKKNRRGRKWNKRWSEREDAWDQLGKGWRRFSTDKKKRKTAVRGNNKNGGERLNAGMNRRKIVGGSPEGGGQGKEIWEVRFHQAGLPESLNPKGVSRDSIGKKWVKGKKSLEGVTLSAIGEAATKGAKKVSKGGSGP